MTIYLKDFIEAVQAEAHKRNAPGHDYSAELIEKSIKANVSDNLRANLKTGKTYNKSLGLATEVVHKSDIRNYETLEAAAIWEFTGFVRNSASRLSRGYSAI